MTLGTRRIFYRVRNNFYGWTKLVIFGAIICYLTRQFLP